jgi:hypothetical protein
VKIAVRVGVVLGTVENVAVAVEVLGVEGALNEGVGRDESPDLGVVVAAAVVVQARFGVELLTGKSLIGIEGAFGSGDRATILERGLSSGRIHFVSCFISAVHRFRAATESRDIKVRPQSLFQDIKVRP